MDKPHTPKRCQYCVCV